MPSMLLFQGHQGGQTEEENGRAGGNRGGARQRLPPPLAEGAALPCLGVSGFEIDAHRLLDLAQPQR